MKPSALLQKIRGQGIVLWIEGAQIHYNAPRGTVSPELRREIAAHKPALLALLRASWWPEDRPKPNLLDLAREYGPDPTRVALLAAGCDLAAQMPSWEQLFVAAERLRLTQTRRPQPRAQPLVRYALPRALALKARLRMSTARFSLICQQVIGKPGIGSGQDDDAVTAVLEGLVKEREGLDAQPR